MRKLIAAVAATATLIAAPVTIAAADHGAPAVQTTTIVDVASTSESFTTLTALLIKADLAGALQSDGPFTVFAPTNAAFEKLPAGTIDSLLQPENKAKLQAVLKYHVLSGQVLSTDLAGKQISAETLQGGDIHVDATNGVQINNANVVTADVKTDNGVIHIIDTVLIP